MFKKLFGGAKDPAPPVQAPTVRAANQTINSIQALADQEETLEKRKALLEKKMDAELEKARELNKAGKKPQALMCLKRKKLMEADMTNIDNLILKVSEQRIMLEGQRTTVGLGTGLRVHQLPCSPCCHAQHDTVSLQQHGAHAFSPATLRLPVLKRE